jgi:hypothetical protein
VAEVKEQKLEIGDAQLRPFLRRAVRAGCETGQNVEGGRHGGVGALDQREVVGAVRGAQGDGQTADR